MCTPDKIYEVMALFSVGDSFEKIARKTGVSPRTVSNIVKRNRGKPEFEELKEKAQDKFIEDATAVIADGLTLIKTHFGRLLASGEELNAGELAKIATVVGTLYDKRALAQGDATENTKVTVSVPEEVAVYGV